MNQMRLRKAALQAILRHTVGRHPMQSELGAKAAAQPPPLWLVPTGPWSTRLQETDETMR